MYTVNATRTLYKPPTNPMSEIKNILFIMADQLRADHLACYGHPYIKTPNLDALAKRGVRFKQAFVNSGVCVPYRMRFYSGRYHLINEENCYIVLFSIL